MQQTIQPGEQMWVNFADLIHHGVPDRKGNVLPADLNSATYDLQDLNPSPGSLMQGTLVLDNVWGNQVQPQLPECCGFPSPAWDPDSYEIGVGGVFPGYIEGVDECNDQLENISYDFSAWSSKNPAVAAVTTEQVQGVSPGFTTGSAGGWVLEGSGDICAERDVQVSVPITVQVPTASRITQTLSSHSVNSASFPTCTGTQAGWYRQVEKIVTDQNGADIVLSGQNLSETVTVGTPNDLGITGTPQMGTAVTDESGNFDDTFFVCSSSCPASSGQTDLSQTISDVLPSGGNPYNLSPNALVYKCTSITINGQ